VVVVVLVSGVVVLVVVGTVMVRETEAANWSTTSSTGPSCVGVPHFLRDPLKEFPAFVPHAWSTDAPLCAAFE
jgi:hypothetical protein